MLNNKVDNRINECLNNMDINSKYKLLEQLETKNLGKNEKADPKFIESIVNVILDTATLIVKCLGIVK
jgi:hypothetical protein